MLPEGVHQVKGANGRLYHYWQPHRGTAAEAPRVRIPHDPGTPQFWAFVAAQGAPKTAGKTVAGMIAAYRASAAYEALKPVSRRDYDRYLDEFERRLGDYRPSDVSAPVVLAIQDSMAAKAVTANHMTSVIRTLYTWGVPRGWATVNPAREVEPIPVESDGAKPWPIDMIRLALTSCRWEVQMFVALGYFTGQRTKDILRARLSDVAGDVYRVKQSKTGTALEIPLHRDLKPFVEKARERGYLVMVPGPKGRELSTNDWRAMWTREMAKEPQGAIRRADLSPHGLRKAAVVALLEAGCSVKLVQSVTGQSLQMIEHYGRLYAQRKLAEQAIDLFENASPSVLQMPAKVG